MPVRITTLINSADKSHQAAIWKYFTDKCRGSLATFQIDFTDCAALWTFLLASVVTPITANTYEYISTENDNV